MERPGQWFMHVIPAAVEVEVYRCAVRGQPAKKVRHPTQQNGAWWHGPLIHYIGGYPG
jgi:hypothetical protein